MTSEMEQFTDVFRALSDKTRLRIIWLLCAASARLCVCEIMDALNESQHNVSRHLKVLKGAGLVREEKEGKWAYYFLTSPQNKFQELILQTISGIPEELLFLDKERLNMRLSLRVEGKCVVGVDSEEWRRISNRLTEEEGKAYAPKAN